MVKKISYIFLVIFVMSNVSWAGNQYSIKEMTPAVEQALQGRKERFGQIRSLKEQGILGENNQGYVEVLIANSTADMLAAQENQNRRIIYQTIAKQNGLEGALATIEAAFAEVQREKAMQGEKIQTASGVWMSKS